MKTKYLKKIVLLTLSIAISCSYSYAVKKRVLFIGNSYTYQNNLPQMLKDVAASTGDTVEYDSYAPGGYTLKQHASDNNTINKIMIGNWDYVVLQEQSQRPAFPEHQVQADLYPYARILDSLIRHYNSCAETVFYMTWGYKNGDASNCANFPPICTYAGMDSMLRARYMYMADTNNAIVSPVGAVRRYIRTNYPGIELYDTDGAHPSLAGTYSAACSFYSVLFRKDPLNITFNSTLTFGVATNIRSAAKVVAYDSLSTWFVGAYDPVAKFIYTPSGTSVSFSNQSSNAQQFQWSFGDGNTSTQANPTHTYTSSGSYTVQLIAKNCGQSDTTVMTVNIGILSVPGVLSADLLVFPNPVKDILVLQAPSYLLEDISLIDSRGAALSVTVKAGSADRTFIDISRYPPGVYYLKVTINGSEETRKIVKY